LNGKSHIDGRKGKGERRNAKRGNADRKSKLTPKAEKSHEDQRGQQMGGKKEGPRKDHSKGQG